MLNLYNNRGIALFIAVALMFLLSIGAIVVLLTAYNYANITENQIRRTRALVLAEAGIHYAWWKLRTDPTYTGSTIDPESSGNNVVITVTGPVSGKYTIRSTVTY